MKERLRNLRNRLRFFWLWLVHEYQITTNYCQRCGIIGAAVCSLVYPKRLCNDCAKEVHRMLEDKCQKQ